MFWKRDKSFAQQREEMVRQQIQSRGVQDSRVLKAFQTVPREQFVPPESLNQAYGDHPLPIGHGQTISQPYIVALMTEALEPTPEDIVLEVGTGSGYQAAILGELVKKVYSLERFAELAQDARSLLNQLGYRNVVVINQESFKVEADEVDAFDKIIVTAAANQVPQELVAQLKEGGKMVIPVGGMMGQELLVITKSAGESHTEKSLGGCRFVPLKT